MVTENENRRIPSKMQSVGLKFHQKFLKKLWGFIIHNLSYSNAVFIAMKCYAHAVDKISMSVTERAKFKCRSDGRLAFSLVSISFV